MFDLFRSRDKAVRYLLGALLTVVALSMITYLIPGFGTQSTTGTTADPVLAEVGSRKITSSDAQQEFKRISSGRIPADLMETYFPQVVESMIVRNAAIYEAERLGLTVSDEEVLNGLMGAYPQFFQTGALAQDQFEAALTQQGLTSQGVLDDMKEQLLLHKLRDGLMEGVVVSPKEIEDAFVAKYERAKVEYIAFPPAKFRDQVKISDEDLKKEFEKQKAAYAKPEKLAFQVVLLSQDKVEATINVSDDQLRAAYSSSLDNFRMPERVHVRHILISTTGKSDAEKKPLEAKAQDLLKQLKNGADFAELAKKNSADAADAGGDLGWIVHNQMVPEFDQAAFSLKPKELSGVVTSKFGYHIIQVLEREPAHLKSFEEVKADLAKEVRAQTITDTMQMLGDKIHAALVKEPKMAAEIAKQYGADLITQPGGLPGEALPPPIGNSPEISAVIPAMKADQVSDLLVLPMNREAVVVMNGRIPGRPAELSEVEGQIRDKLTTDQAAIVASQKAKEVAEQLKKGEDFDKLAKSMKLDVVTSSNFGRADSIEGLGPAAYLEDAFGRPVGAILGPYPIQGRDVIAKVIERTPADMTALPVERDALAADLREKKAQAEGNLLMDSIMAKLTDEGKVKINRKEIQRVMATFHVGK